MGDGPPSMTWGGGRARIRDDGVKLNQNKSISPSETIRESGRRLEGRLEGHCGVLGPSPLWSGPGQAGLGRRVIRPHENKDILCPKLLRSPPQRPRSSHCLAEQLVSFWEGVPWRCSQISQASVFPGWHGKGARGHMGASQSRGNKEPPACSEPLLCPRHPWQAGEARRARVIFWGLTPALLPRREPLPQPSLP